MARNRDLPAFPKVIEKILSALDDPDASINLLVDYVEHDPVITGLVLSLANRAGNTRGGGAVHDVFTAISLVGLARVREITEVVSVASFMKGWVPANAQHQFWVHSMAVAACGVELVNSTLVDVSVDTALVAGLMHNVGQLWLQRFHAAEFEGAMRQSRDGGVDISAAEREWFGVDHGVIGAWLAHSWGVPAGIVSAVQFHHVPDARPDEPLVAVVHVAEVLCNALDLTGSGTSRVTSISPSAFQKMGLDRETDATRLFGRIEARSRFSRALFEK